MLDTKERGESLDLKKTRERAVAQIRLNLRQMSDDNLLILALQQDKDELNYQVDTGSFPAWDIAYRLKSNGWAPSAKQRMGIINVLTYYLTDVFIQKKLNEHV